MFKHRRHRRFNLEYLESEEHQARKKRSRLFWGIILIGAGLTFLARNLGWIAFEIPAGLLSWKLIFVVMAVNFLIHGRFWGTAIMAFLAIMFYTPELVGHELWEYKKKLWPLIPIFIGTLFLLKMNKKKELSI